MSSNYYQEHNPPPPQNIQIPQQRAQRLSTPVEPPSKNYSSPPRSRSRRHSTAEEISPTAKLGTGAGVGPQFRDVDWGTTTTTDNGKMLRDRVSEISKCASDVEKLVDGYLEEHSEMQRKLKAKVSPVSVPASKTRVPKNGGKNQAFSVSTISETSVAQVQDLKDKISELENRIKHMERNHQKELSAQETSSSFRIQKIEARHKVEIESLQTQLADTSLKLQNHKTKVESLTDQKAHLIFEKDQLQSKIEDHTAETTEIHTKLEKQVHQTRELRARLKGLSQERDEAIKQYDNVQNEANLLKNIIQNCKYCANIWEFTQHRGSIDVNVWYCDINQGGAYTLLPHLESPLAQVDEPHVITPRTSSVNDKLLAEKFKSIIQDIEKLCNLVAFRSSYLDFYMKTIDTTSFSTFKLCLQNQTLDSEIFLPYLQHQIWHQVLNLNLKLQPLPANSPTFSKAITQTLKLHDAETSGIQLSYTTLTAQISTIADTLSTLFATLNSSDNDISITLSPLKDKDPTTGLDLFPIIRRTDGALLLGRISVKNIEENAAIIPITPIIYQTLPSPNINAAKILVPGTAIVYEPKRSAPFPRSPSITGKPTQKPHVSQGKPPSPDTPTKEEPNSPKILPRLPSFPKTQRPAPPPVLRPCLHRKPKLPPLDTTAITATPANSPVLQRTIKPTPTLPPPIPQKSLILKRGSAHKGIGGNNPFEAKDLQANEELQYTKDLKSTQDVSPDVNVANKRSHQSHPSNISKSGTPLAAIWRTLEELDKKKGPRSGSP
ncbi:hypothetical protein TWF718_009272 [Orbilia javanica]|uniref:Uncharacterized protein n=1 Tax=Orbilia javanica TaxID=47235 RepID=A0AAN8MRG2_9PEZI